MRSFRPALAGAAAAMAAAFAACAATTPAPAPATAASLPAGQGRDLIMKKCIGCHDLAMAVQGRHTAEAWDVIVGQMVDRGAVASEDEQIAIADYLAAHFGPGPAVKP